MAANSGGHERLAADDEQPFMERASVSTRWLAGLINEV